jgi:hypothetical protein
MDFARWTTDDWVRHYTGPRWSGRAEVGSAWDEQGRRIPGERVRCGAELVILTTSDVRDAKADLDVDYGKLADDMAACNLLDEAEREEFDGHLRAWRSFYCGGAPDGRREPHVEVVALGAQMNEVDRFAWQLRDWRERLAEHYAAGDTEEQRADKRRQPVLILAAVAAGFYFFGPSVHRELFSPVMIRKNLVERRRQAAIDMGESDVAFDSGKGIGADLALKVNDALNLPSAGRLAMQPTPALPALPPATPPAAATEVPKYEPEPEPEPTEEAPENEEE